MDTTRPPSSRRAFNPVLDIGADFSIVSFIQFSGTDVSVNSDTNSPNLILASNSATHDTWPESFT
jgi:hypothetical protein